jgi:hypothetical protein
MWPGQATLPEGAAGGALLDGVVGAGVEGGLEVPEGTDGPDGPAVGPEVVGLDVGRGQYVGHSG